MSFAALKSNRSNFSKLAEELEKTSNPQQTSSNKDERFWKPEVDKSGNGYAVIRFLPQPQGEDLPWVRVFNHGFKGPGGWLIDNCLTTINKKCPICEANSELWQTGSTANQNIVRERKRKLKYVSNIYVVKDPANPHNEGKVFLYQFGKKIFDKLQDMMRPEFEDENPVNPFDFWDGANFKLKIRRVDGYQNYDKSEFDSTSALSEDESELETIYNSQHSLEEFVSPDKFKSYDALKDRLGKVLGSVQTTTSAERDVYVDETPAPVMPEVSAPTFEDKSWKEPQGVSSKVDDDDEDFSYFEKLAAED
jgi:hypothetical protein